MANDELAIANVSTLSFVAGYLAGAADRRFRTGTRWTVKVYMEGIVGRKMSLAYVQKLERAIAKRWPEGETPPSMFDVMRGPEALEFQRLVPSATNVRYFSK
jgi:hypothetical protein